MAAERPKRPLSAYMIWLNEAREGIKKEFPGIKVTEIAKKGGEMWRNLKDKTVSFFFIIKNLKEKTNFNYFFVCFKGMGR